MPISRGQMPRQLYGLGSLVKSIGKAVKGAVKSVGKVAKSPLGLAAIGLGVNQFGIPGIGGKGFLGKIKPFLLGTASTNDMPGTPGLLNTLRLTKAGFGEPFELSTFGKVASVVAPSVIGGMLTKEAQEDVEQLRESGDRGLLQGYLRRYYGNLNPRASAEEIEEFVRVNSAEGGRIQYAMGSPEENAIQASGIMGLPLNENPAGVTELDLRESGGFIPPVGVKEKADDIPAMLSNNEFVFTADAVRGMGDGDVNKGAQRMYDMMKKLENGGRV